MRNGEWMQTFSGGQFWPLDPRPEDIHIEDIAAALSKLCRFTGHCQRLYSMAEHAIHVARSAPEHLKLTALLHDGSEAYCNDLARPLKRSLLDYVEIEDNIQIAIYHRFKLHSWPFPDIIKRLDNAMLATERAQVMARPPAPWVEKEPPLDVVLQFWSPDEAQVQFMSSFYVYGGEA